VVKLDPAAVIPPEKVRDYLLTPQEDGDKSGYFALAGYDRADWQRLAVDLRAQILPLDATFSREGDFGAYYTVEGPLQGPNG
jgi:hypothetical protein